MANAVLDEMTTDLAVELSLDEFEAVADELAAAERHRSEKLAAAQQAIDRALALPTIVRSMWQKVIREPSTALNEIRGEIEETFRRAIGFVDHTVRVVPKAEALAGGPLPGSDQLPATRAELAALVDMIFSRWTSQEELEELMAETFELPSWVTEGKIPPHLQPPQSWYDETIDPTKPADA